MLNVASIKTNTGLLSILRFRAICSSTFVDNAFGGGQNITSVWREGVWLGWKGLNISH